MVTLSNTLSSMQDGNVEFSDPVTKVTYDQFSKVPLRLGMVSAWLGTGTEGQGHQYTLGCDRSWEKRRQRGVGKAMGTSWR